MWKPTPSSRVRSAVFTALLFVSWPPGLLAAQDPSLAPPPPVPAAPAAELPAPLPTPAPVSAVAPAPVTAPPASTDAPAAPAASELPPSIAVVPAPAAAPASVAAPAPAVAPAPAAAHGSLSAPRRDEDERPNSSWARAELAVGQMVVGAAMGVEVCVLADCDTPRAGAGTVLLGGAAGLTVSLLATRDGISRGRAQAINTGSIFGAWVLGAAYGATGPERLNENGTAAALLVGHLAGAGLSVFADHHLQLSSGEVSLANSAALWTGIVSVLGSAAVDAQAEPFEERRRFLGATLATTSLALVGGGWLARHDHVSRGRALMVDVGAITGGGALPLIAWLIGGDGVSREALLWSGAAGTMGGALSAYLLTRGWDAPDGPALSMSVSPTDGGALGSVSVRL